MTDYMLLRDFKDYIKDYYDYTDKPYIFDNKTGKRIDKEYYLNKIADEKCEDLKKLSSFSLELFRGFLKSEIIKIMNNKERINIEDLRYIYDDFMKKYFYKYINDDNEIISGDLYILIIGDRETAVENNKDKIKNILHKIKSDLYYVFRNPFIFNDYYVDFSSYSSNSNSYKYNPFETMVEYKDLTDKNFKPIYEYVRQQIKNAVKEMGLKKAYKDYTIIRNNIEKKLFGCVRCTYDKRIKEIGKPEDYGYLKYNIYMNPYDLTNEDFIIIYDKVCKIFIIMQNKIKCKISELIKRKRENKEKEDEEELI